VELVLVQGVTVASAVALEFFEPDALVLAVADALAAALLVAVPLGLTLADGVALAAGLAAGLAVSLAGLLLVLALAGLVTATSGLPLGVADLAAVFAGDGGAVDEHPVGGAGATPTGLA
jgi:hypothetical protein